MAINFKALSIPVAAVLIALTILLVPIAARAAADNRVAATYVVEIGRLPVLKMKYNAILTGNNYQSTAEVEANGFGGLFSDYRMDMAAIGSVSGRNTSPAHFRSNAEKGSKTKAIEVTWRDGQPPLIDPNPKPNAARLLDGSLTADLADPLSMMLRVTTLRGDHPCQGAERAFDGKEVYELRFVLEGKVALGSDEQGSYRGQAYKCVVTYRPVAGRSAVKFKEKGLAPMKFQIWFASARSDDRTLLLPVLATGKLKGLSFVAYTSNTTVDGIPLTSRSD